MLILKFFLTGAAFLLVTGCVVPLGGYYGGYGGYNSYGDYPTYPSYPSWGYSYPSSVYAYPSECPEEYATRAYPTDPMAFAPPGDCQIPVYPSETEATVSDPQSPDWRWQARRQRRYHRQHHYPNHQEGSYPIPPETEQSVAPGTDPSNSTAARPRHRQRLGGDHLANHQGFQSSRGDGPQRMQRPHPQSFPSEQRPHMANQQHRMKAPMTKPAMSPPTARSNPTPSMRAPQSNGNTTRQASRRAPQSEGRKPRQKTSTQGSQ